MNEGIYLNMPAAEYHGSPGVSNTMLKHLRRSPAHLQEYLQEGIETTEEMMLGTLAHSRILEPDQPLPKIALIPETYPAPADCSAVKQKKCQPGDPLPWHGGANYCRLWKQNIEAAGGVVLTKERMAVLNGMVEALKGSPRACDALGQANGISEVSIFTRFCLGGEVLRRMRLDFVHVGSCLVDVKTCEDARLDRFRSHAYDMGYHRQAAYYLDGFNDAVRDEVVMQKLRASMTEETWIELKPIFQPKETFVFIAIERKPPHGICFFQVHPNALEKGREEYVEGLRLYIECARQDTWPAYTDEIQLLDVPEWAKGKILRY